MLKRVGICLPLPVFHLLPAMYGISWTCSFNNMTVAIIEGHQQYMESSRLIMSNISYW